MSAEDREAKEAERLVRLGDGVKARFQRFKERKGRSALPPLHKDSTDEEWEERARLLGVSSGLVLKEQTMLADSILEELFAEERKEPKSR